MKDILQNEDKSKTLDDGHFTAEEQKLYWKMLKKVSVAYKQTNADRVRAMTDEELAECFFHTTSCPCVAVKSNCGRSDIACRTAWLDWMKEEAE